MGFAMSKKKSSLIEFQKRYTTEGACIETLARIRWPRGHACARCGHKGAYRLRSRPRVFQCVECGHQESVTAGTIFHRTRTSLVKWFWMAYLIGRDKRGVSALFLSRELALRYETAWLMAHKIRHALTEGGGLLGGLVEVDETYYGGRGPSESRGRSISNHNKELIVMAVERVRADEKEGDGIKSSGYVAGDLRIKVLPSADSKTIGRFVRSQIKPGSRLFTDGFRSYLALNDGYDHLPTIAGRGKQAVGVLPIVHTLFGNFKAWLNGTFHGVKSKHLPRYIREWSYRTNRRKNIPNILDYILKRAVMNPTITLDQLINGKLVEGPIPALTG